MKVATDERRHEAMKACYRGIEAIAGEELMLEAATSVISTDKRWLDVMILEMNEVVVVVRYLMSYRLSLMALSP